ncbi:MAG: chitobiase/beta-hexosaminidase C-terminal domain-containing protein [Bacteroidaceae bacterium]|nr:chitobiase/beta-hexosaminidase C-terminal domain-containing protein [Bacteroidaceae bacterium]
MAIEVPAGCNVFYTLDGTEPNDGSTLYEGPFVVTETTTVKAISYDADDQTSAVVTGVYTITKPVPVVEGEVVNFDFDANEWVTPSAQATHRTHVTSPKPSRRTA